MSKGPDAYIKLAIFVQKRSLDVLLNYPVRELKRCFNEARDVLEFVEDLDALALVLVRRLHQPYVLLAMLLRQLFFHLGSLRYGLELSHKLEIFGAFKLG